MKLKNTAVLSIVAAAVVGTTALADFPEEMTNTSYFDDTFNYFQPVYIYLEDDYIQNPIYGLPDFVEDYNIRGLFNRFRDTLMREIAESYSSRWAGIEGFTPPDGDSAIFDTSFEWGDSVSSHWAIFRMDRFLGGAFVDYATWIKDNKYTDENLRLEGIFVQGDHSGRRWTSNWEIGKGQTWFTHLASEYYNWAILTGLGEAEASRLVDFDGLTDQMLEHTLGWAESLSASARLTGRDWTNAAWSITKAYGYAFFRNDAVNVERAANFVNESFVLGLGPGEGPTFDDDLTPVDRGRGPRLSLRSFYGNILIAVMKTQDNATLVQWLQDHPVSETGLAVPESAIDPEGWHAPDFATRAAEVFAATHLWDRMRAFQLLRDKIATGDLDSVPNIYDLDDKLKIAFAEHYNAAMRLHRLHQNNWTYTTLVSQAAVEAFTDGFDGEPTK